MRDARQIAYEILLKIHNENAYSNLALDAALEADDLEGRDSALVSALVYGTLERLITIDYNLSLYLKQPIKKLQPETLTALRMGVCQLLFMNKIPVSAAVNESVKLIKLTRSAFSSGLVNAVLRKAAKEGLRLPLVDNNNFEYLSIKYSCPAWLISLWTERYGLDNTIGIIESSLRKPPVIVRVNTLTTTPDDLIKLLDEDGVSAKPCEEVENALVLVKTGAIERLSAFKNGLFHVQDTSSQLCCKALEAQPDDIIFDLCSAPGGKAFTIAEIMKGKGQIKAFDIYESRLYLIRSGALRLNLTNLVLSVGDAGVFNENIGFADKVLCDVPCSGLGIIRRKPEIRYKTSEVLDKLPDLQYFILCNASKYVKVGGLLLYSTCTLNSKENEEVCELFLKEHHEYKAKKVLPDLKNRFEDSNYLTLLPHINNSDGFFIALFIRIV